MSDPVEAYFAELRDVRASGGGVAETSAYPALATLLNEIGKTLKPKVRAVSQLRNLGAGAPPEKARCVTEMVRRVAALVLMQPELDANYERVKADVWEWGT